MFLVKKIILTFVAYTAVILPQAAFAGEVLANFGCPKCGQLFARVPDGFTGGSVTVKRMPDGKVSNFYTLQLKAD